MLSKRAQGAFEYILLLAGILLIVVVVIMVLRVSVIPAANQTLQGGLQQWQQLVLLAPSASLSLSGNDSLGVAFSDPVDPNSISGNLSSNLTYVLGPDNFTTTDNKVFILKTSLSDLVLDAGTHSLNVTAVSASTGASANASLSFVKEVQLRTSPYSADGNTLLLCHFDDGYSCEQGEQGKFEGEYNLDEYPANTVLLMHFNNNTAIGESTTNAVDESGYGNNGTFYNASIVCGNQQGCPSWVNGKFGKAISFDRDGDSVKTGASSSLNITDRDYTIEVWYKPDEIGLWKGTFEIGYAYDRYALYGSHSDKPFFYQQLMDDSYVEIYGNTLSVGVWVHVAVTYENSTNTWKIYQNGVLVSNTTKALRAKPQISARATIGTVGASWFNGTIDEVRVLNRSLSAQEVWQHFKAKAGKFGKGALVERTGEALTFSTSGATVLFNQTVGLWRLGEGTGNTTADESPNKNDGILINNSQWVDGKYGKALQFNGVDNRVTIADSASLRGMTSLTIEAWIKPNQVNIDSRPVQKKWNYFLGIATYNPGKVTFQPYVNSTCDNIQIDSNSNVTVNSWTHVVAVLDKVNHSMKIYLNGVLDAESTGVYFDSVCNTNFSGGDLTIGTIFNGSTDEVAIYNRALSADEVRQHYSGNFNASQGTLEMWVKPSWNTTYSIYGGLPTNLFTYYYNSTNRLELRYSTENRWIEFVNRYYGAPGGVEFPLSGVLNWQSNELHHVASTWSATDNKMKLFIDGVLVNQSTFSGLMPVGRMYVGSYVGTMQANAVIDELRISNVTRTDFATTTYHAA
jgi:hypothetical protein